MIPKGIVLVTKKVGHCPGCHSMRIKLDDMVANKMIDGYTEIDVMESGLPLGMSVPQLMKNRTTLLLGDHPDYTLKYIKKILGV